MTEQARTQRTVTVQEVEQRTSFWYAVLRILLVVVTAPYRRAFKLYTWRPLRELRAADGDRQVLIPLVKDWKVEKYAELQSVQVAATFCGGAAFSSLPWASAANAIWPIEALWFSSLICAIFAIVTSIQTKSILDDLPAQEQLDASLPEVEVRRMRRTILRYKRKPGIKHWVMLFIWQFPSMTTAYAWYNYVTGLTVYLCAPLFEKAPWQGRHKIAIVYLSLGLIGVVTYILSTIFVYLGEKDYEQSAANTLASTMASTRAPTIDLESGMLAKNAGTQTSVKATKDGSSSADEIDPVQTVLSRGVFTYSHEERMKRHAERSPRAKRQLLY